MQQNLPEPAQPQYISSKKLQSLEPAIYAVIDGANLILHPGKSRMMAVSDEIDINNLVQKKKLDPNDLNMELLYNTLRYLHGTALNLAGLLRVFIRTGDNTIIALDPRLQIPSTFDAFSFMMWRFSREQLIKGQGGERLMWYVKRDIGESMLPGVPRYHVYTSPDDKLTQKLTDIIQKDPVCIYVNIHPDKPCADEIMQGSMCVSNDDLNCTAVFARIVNTAELAHAIW